MGAYRRRIRLVAADAAVVADLEDDFHRFRVTLRHDGTRVVAVEGEALRHPWTACPGAVEPLRLLAGMPLAPSATAIRDHGDPRQNCTHLFDLAGLAVAHAASGRSARTYDAVVPDRVHLRTWATLARDGEPLLAWDVDGLTIDGPAPFAGVALRGSFIRWATETLDPDTAEAAIVLRRACEISFGRLQDLDAIEVATELGGVMLGTCHAFQPERIELARRVKGTTRDFSDAADALLAE